MLKNATTTRAGQEIMEGLVQGRMFRSFLTEFLRAHSAEGRPIMAEIMTTFIPNSWCTYATHCFP
jgi:hypothetical protein